MQLFPYQRDGVRFLTERQVAGLFDAPGLGKTAQLCRAWAEIGAATVLVICPASLRAVWRQEVERWGAGEPHVITQPEDDVKRGTVDGPYGTVKTAVNICSYNGASGSLFELLMVQSYDVLVLDESHFVKSLKAKRTVAVYGKNADGSGLISRAKRVWLATGTPVPNDPSEVYPMMRALFPDAIQTRRERPMTYWQFASRFCEMVNNGFGWKIVGGKNLGQLRDRLRERTLRRRKEQVLKDLPPIRFDTLPVTGKLTDLPSSEVAYLAEALKSGDVVKTLREIAPHVTTLRRMTGLAKVRGTVEWLHESGVENAVIFAVHRDVIASLMSSLSDAVQLHGGTPAEQREEAVRKFQSGEARWFVGQMQSAGTGLTLTKANTLVFVEPSWVPADNEQAAMRIHRIGQMRGCVAYFATIPGSIDEAVMRAVARKTATIRELGL